MSTRTVFVIAAFVLTSCSGSGGNSGSAEPLNASDIAKEFKTLKRAAVSKYGDKEIFVRGFTYSAAKLSPMLDGSAPKNGLVLLKDKGDENYNEVYCEFEAADLAQFEQIKGNQYVTVRGRLADEDKPRLKPCKMVKVE